MTLESDLRSMMKTIMEPPKMRGTLYGLTFGGRPLTVDGVGFRVPCDRCGSPRRASELNLEALIHHNARALECIDRKACSKRARRRKRLANG